MNFGDATRASIGRSFAAVSLAGLIWASPAAVAQGAGPEIAEGGPASGPSRPIAILQIGDSHTAADFLTGQVRRLLQAEFGDGGAGYVAPGRPRSGVRSSAMKIEASSGWTYLGLQGAKNDRSFFALSGFEATATAAGETLTYSSETPISWDEIEIETVAQPNGGRIQVSLDGKVESEFPLEAPTKERIVLRLTPEQTRVDRLQRVKIETTSASPVTISGVAVRNRSAGVSLSAVGFPGATVDIVNRYDGDTFKQEIKRFAPDVIILAFGTNEGFNDDLDPGAYTTSYRRVLGRVRRAAPTARIVVVAPPNGNRLTPGCKAEAAKAACAASSRRGEPAVTGALSDAEGDQGSKTCVWRAPPNLARVREAQRKIAEEERLVFWDWSEVMPADCGAHEWSKATPPLMADDHVHMTVAGYRQSAERFVPVLRSVLGQLQGRRDALPDN